MDATRSYYSQVDRVYDMYVAFTGTEIAIDGSSHCGRPAYQVSSFYMQEESKRFVLKVEE